MTARKKKGIGFLITAGIFAIVGGVFIGTDVTPEWVGLLTQGIGLIAGLLGFKIVSPDTE